MTMARFLILLLFSLYGILNGQDIAIGDWKSHLPYQRGISVTQSADKVIYATPLSIFTIDKVDNSVTFLSKVEGLSDIGIRKVHYDEFNNQLFVLYNNSNIDIVRGSGIINIPNILLNNSIIGNKRINDIYFSNEQTAFISAEFGIVEFNTQNLTFGSTIRTGVPIRQMSSRNDILYAATSEGVYFIRDQENAILSDFSQWNFLGSEFGMPELYNSVAIVNHQGAVYIGADGNLFKFESKDSIFIIHQEMELELKYLTSSNDLLITGWNGPDFQSKVLFFNDDDAFIANGANCLGVTQDALLDEKGTIWYADLFNNIRFAESYSSPCSQIRYNSPFSEKSSDIVVKDDLVLVASGGVAENFTFLFSRDGFYFLNERNWLNFNEFENSTIRDFDALSIFRVAFHPSISKLYAASYWAGLVEYDFENNNYQLYNKTNSSLRGAIGDPARERVTGLAFDEDENLWVSTYNAPEPINVLTREGRWLSFSVPSRSTLSEVVVDDVGYKWFTVHGNNGGVLVYDSGPSVQSTADDRFRFITSNNSELSTNNVISIVKDLDGEVWVGTNEGPVIFDCGTQVFDVEVCQGIRRKIVQDSIVAFLLADQQINVMAVDGADQKWFGTRNGLFVQSPQGDEQIAHFTVNNSPLFDNEIQSLAYEGETGIMWIGTNRGLLSLRTESTAGKNMHREDEVIAFPNPVDPDYFGPVAIRGLTADANVKITDVNGLLVTELTALGGQAIWDQRDLKGNEVQSGVYLVFSTDVSAFDRPDAFVTKILILR